MKTPHKHAEYIKAWADGEKLQYRMIGIEQWTNVDPEEFRWTDGIEVRFKPKKPQWYYMRDNHTFRGLEGSVEEMIDQIIEELEAGYTSGMLCTKDIPKADVHCDYRKQAKFLREAKEMLKCHIWTGE